MQYSYTAQFASQEYLNRFNHVKNFDFVPQLLSPCESYFLTKNIHFSILYHVHTVCRYIYEKLMLISEIKFTLKYPKLYVKKAKR